MITPDTGVTLALVRRFETQRLPRALALRDKTVRGERLSDYEIECLLKTFDDLGHMQYTIEHHPVCSHFAACIMHLYKEICDRALDNENNYYHGRSMKN